MRQIKNLTVLSIVNLIDFENYTNDTITSANDFMEYNVEFFISAVQEGCALLYKIYMNYEMDDEIFRKSGLVAEDVVKFLFMSLYDKFDSIEFLNIFVEQVTKLSLDVKVKEEYRTLRKELRGRIVGGGFGVSGAVKGMLTASVANAATGVVHGVVNTVTNVYSKLKYDRTISNFILNRDTRDALVQYFRHDLELLKLVNSGIYGSVMKFLLTYSETERKFLEIKDIFSKEQKKCKSLDEKIDLAIDTMEYIPFCSELYDYVLKEIGDSRMELDDIANYVHFDINNFKKSFISTYAKELDDTIYGQEYKKLLMECANRSGFDLEKKANSDLIEDLIRERNLSVIEVKLIGEKLDTINGLNHAIERLSKLDCDEAQKYISQYRREIKNIEEKFENAYNEIVVNIDLSSQKSLGKAIKFLSAFESSAIDNKIQELQKKKQDNINTMIQQLNCALPHAKKIEEYKKREETVDNKLWANAHSSLTPEDMASNTLENVFIALMAALGILCLVIFVGTLINTNIVVAILVTGLVGGVFWMMINGFFSVAFENRKTSSRLERRLKEYLREERDGLLEQKREIQQSYRDYCQTEECRKCFDYLPRESMDSNLITSVVQALKSGRVDNIDDGIREYNRTKTTSRKNC